MAFPGKRETVYFFKILLIYIFFSFFLLRKYGLKKKDYLILEAFIKFVWLYTMLSTVTRMLHSQTFFGNLSTLGVRLGYFLDQNFDIVGKNET